MDLVTLIDQKQVKRRWRFLFTFTNVFIYVTADSVYVLQMFFFVFFSSAKNMRQPFLGTAERIFIKLLPNDTGENGVCNVVPPPGEWLKISLCWFMLVLYCTGVAAAGVVGSAAVDYRACGTIQCISRLRRRRNTAGEAPSAYRRRSVYTRTA